ncbi:hypothetical protein PSI23_11505 [Xenorhabdus sp. XENO-10]|uniref:Uncharacterized protein n=1 Tax=Xenorhabdus yunnanensis TaxID=3025878 RepID=A0ABT5LH47_9GAMM|nr:hypothetical protein [Xenorhabdus yunnanensis]MDC9589908.1 hypothetical protein [Xenorhabdus yunnanensis]
MMAENSKIDFGNKVLLSPMELFYEASNKRIENSYFSYLDKDSEDAVKKTVFDHISKTTYLGAPTNNPVGVKVAIISTGCWSDHVEGYGVKVFIKYAGKEYKYASVGGDKKGYGFGGNGDGQGILNKNTIWTREY